MMAKLLTDRSKVQRDQQIKHVKIIWPHFIQQQLPQITRAAFEAARSQLASDEEELGLEAGIFLASVFPNHFHSHTCSCLRCCHPSQYIQYEQCSRTLFPLVAISYFVVVRWRKLMASCCLVGDCACCCFQYYILGKCCGGRDIKLCHHHYGCCIYEDTLLVHQLMDIKYNLLRDVLVVRGLAPLTNQFCSGHQFCQAVTVVVIIHH